MAYNPFNIFRRNQKIIFAVVTVFIMFTFVLSSGLGGGADFFDWLPQWLGTKGKRGDVVATFDGSKLYARDLDTVGAQRNMANRYMKLGAVYTADGLNSYVSAQLAQLGPEAKQIVGGLVQAENQMNSLRRLSLGPAEQQQLQSFLMQTAQQAQQLRAELPALIANPNLKAADRDVARSKLAATMLEQNISGESELYFNNAPNRHRRDLIQFMLWQKKADQLGIKFSTDDVKQLIEHEFYDAFNTNSQKAVLGQLKTMVGFTMPRCIEAIGEEFRVRAAQTAILGNGFSGPFRGDKTFGGSPLFNVPFEAYDYYREECSPTTYGVVNVPVDNYLDKVTGEPTEDELKQLYDKHRDEEYSPAKEAPGFKESRKIRVEWLRLTGEEAYYQKLAEEQLKLGEPAAKIGSLLTVPLPGAGLVWIGPAVAPTGVKNMLLEAAYKKVVTEQFAADLFDRWGPSFGASQPLSVLDSSVTRPGNLAIAAGGISGQLLGFGNPYAAAAVIAGGPMAYEIRDRVMAGVPTILSTIPGPGLFNTSVGGLVANQMLTPKPLPAEAYRNDLLKSLVEDDARQLARKDISKLIEEVKKLSDGGFAKDMGPARKFIEEFAKTRGLTVRGNKDASTEWTLAEDPELALLVAEQKRSLEASGNPHQNTYIPFARHFFWQPPRRAGEKNPVNGTYIPETYPEGVRNPRTGEALAAKFVVWRAEERGSKVMDYNDAKAKGVLKDAWKRAKARELAKNRADAMAKTIREDSLSSEPFIPSLVMTEAQKLRGEFGTDGKAQERIREFRIDGVAPLTTNTRPTARPLLGFNAQTPSIGQLRPFGIGEGENMKYPSQELVTTLILERKKPVKTVLVLPDAGKNTFFVVTLLKRDVKSEDEFKSAVYNRPDRSRTDDSGGDNTREAVLGSFREAVYIKTQESVDTLIKREFKYVETDEQKKKLDDDVKRPGNNAGP